MTQLFLNDEQMRLLSGASFPVVIVDTRGRKLAEIASREQVTADVQSMTDEEWLAEGIRRRDQALREGGKFSTTQEVLTRLRALKPE